jgi:hypothetical protein
VAWRRVDASPGSRSEPCGAETPWPGDAPAFNQDRAASHPPAGGQGGGAELPWPTDASRPFQARTSSHTGPRRRGLETRRRLSRLAHRAMRGQDSVAWRRVDASPYSRSEPCRDETPWPEDASITFPGSHSEPFEAETLWPGDASTPLQARTSSHAGPRRRGLETRRRLSRLAQRAMRGRDAVAWRRAGF